MTSHHTSTPGFRQVFIAFAALVAVTAALYAPTFSSDFVSYDDPQYVQENEIVRKPTAHGVWRFFSEVTTPSTVAGYYQPLTMLSYVLDRAIAGRPDIPPTICHIHNILLHGITVGLLFLLMKGISSSPSAAYMVALIFAIHPVNVESVCWISQRKTVLATPLAIGSVLCYLRYAERGPRTYLVGSLLLYFAACLAKPTTVFLPLVFPLLDLLRPTERGRSDWARQLEKWPFVIVMAAMAWVAWESQASSKAQLAMADLSRASNFGRWVALLCYNVMLYFGNLFWPLHLAPFRAFPTDLSITNGTILLCVLGTSAVLVVWLTSFKWSRSLFIGLSAFFILLAPALGPVQFMPYCVADRFLYLPLVFLLIPLAVLLDRVEKLHPHKAPMGRMVTGLFLVPFAVLNWGQQSIWRDGKTFWTHTSESVPDDPNPHAHLAVIALQEGRYEEGYQHAVKVGAAESKNPEAYLLLGRASVRTNRAREAIGLIEKALQIGLGKGEPMGYLSMAEARIVLGDFAGARAECERGIAKGLGCAATYVAVAEAASRYGYRDDLALACMREALRCEGDNPEIRESIRKLEARTATQPARTTSRVAP